MELLSARCDESQPTDMNRTDELYEGEFSDLAVCGLYSEGNRELLPPKLKDRVSDTTSAKCGSELSREILQVTDFFVGIVNNKYFIFQTFHISFSRRD